MIDANLLRFAKFCETYGKCKDCPFWEYEEDCQILYDTRPEEVLRVLSIYENKNKSFKAKVLEVFPNFDFNAVCVRSFFKDKVMKENTCDKYSSCEQHYAIRTEQEILEELENVK